MSGALLQQKARNFACITGHDDFVASDGWLQCIENRHDVVGRAVSKESQSVDREAAVAWIEKNIGQLLADKLPCSIRCWFKKTSPSRVTARRAINRARSV